MIMILLMKIHSTAVIHPSAKIGRDCQIGPFCIIGKHVNLGDACRLHSHVVLDGHTTLGTENEIYPFVSIGLKTQDLKWQGGITRTKIGDKNIIREFVTIHSATAEDECTSIGSHNILMAYCHIAHNACIGNHIIISNAGTLAGHVIVEDHAIIGGLAAVHQFCQIGKYALIGGCSKVVQDAPPFMMIDGNPARTRTINKVGLQRKGFDNQQVTNIRRAYQILFRKGLSTSSAVKTLQKELANSAEAQHLIKFIHRSKRGLTSYRIGSFARS